MLALQGCVFAFLLMAKASLALVGFDCGDGESVIASYSLVDKDDCNLKDESLDIRKGELQLLQPRQTLTFDFISCSVEYR